MGPHPGSLHTTIPLLSATMSKQEVHSFVTQRIIIKFLIHVGVKLAEVLRILEGQFGDEALGWIQVAYTFLRWRGAVENEAYKRRQRTEENILVLIEQDPPLTVSETASRVGISRMIPLTWTETTAPSYVQTTVDLSVLVAGKYWQNGSLDFSPKKQRLQVCQQLTNRGGCFPATDR